MLIETRAGQGSDGLVVVLLHGFMGLPEDLRAVRQVNGHRLGASSFPEGIVDLADRGLRG